MNSTLQTLGIIVALGTFGFTLGKALDLYLLKKHKGKLHARLERSWFWLDEKKIPDFPSIVAQWSINAIHWIFGKRLFSWRVLFLSLTPSIILTAIALFLGSYLQMVIEGLLFHYQIINIGETLVLMSINYLFDLLTCIITFRILHTLTKQHSFTFRLGTILFDGSLALICAIMVFPSFMIMTTLLNQFKPTANIVGINFNVHKETLLWLSDIINCMPYSIETFRNCFDPSRTSIVVFVYSATTLIPTLLYLSFILFMIISKYTLIFTKWITGGFLLRAVDDEPHKLQVFTLTGTFLGVLAGLAKLVQFFLTG